MGALLFWMYRLLTKQMQAGEITAPDSPMAYGGLRQYDTWEGIPIGVGGKDDKLNVIREMDCSFTEKRFKDAVLEKFLQIQDAWTDRDLSGARNLLTDEIYEAMQQDAEKLRVQKRINKLDDIAVRSLDITEVWQKGNQTFITVRFNVSMVNYTVDESSGEVVAGRETEHVKLTEYWTFTRSAGNNPWRLSAINSGSHMIR